MSPGGGGGGFNLDNYVDVAERIAELREKHPNASLRPALLERPYSIETIGAQTFIVYTAACYRAPDDPCPGIGTAWEPVPGLTPYTKNSELQNAETSAWGRAIVAALVADTRRGGVSSREEVRNRHDEPDDTAASPPPPPATERQIVSILDRLRPLLGEDDEGKLVYPEEWRAARADKGPGTLALPTLESMVTGDRAYCPETYAAKMAEVLDQIGAEAPATDDPVGSEPCVLCGRTRTDRVIVDGQVRCANATSCRKHAQENPQGEGAPGAAEAHQPVQVACSGCGELLRTPEDIARSMEGEPYHEECRP